MVYTRLKKKLYMCLVESKEKLKNLLLFKITLKGRKIMSQKKPQEILEITMDSAVAKSRLSVKQMILLGLMAGFFIALAGAGANMGAYYLLAEADTAGLGKMLSGIIFPAGLLMVVFAGAELFTGNNLMVAAVLDRRIGIGAMLRNWCIVYLANLIASVCVAWLVVESGLLSTGDGLLEQVTVSIAVSKVNLTFGQAFIRGILCNFLVCIAVWMASGADSTIGKVFSLFFPIWLFVTAGFEHSIANMFFIPAGIFAAGSSAGLSFSGFFLNNLLPVTLGNIVGGSILVAGIYYFAYKGKGNRSTQTTRVYISKTEQDASKDASLDA